METPTNNQPSGPFAPVTYNFIGLYMAAQVGAYIAFIPILTLVLPLKTQAIAPISMSSTQILSHVAFWGAFTASISGVLAGFIGDHTRHWRGGRSVWMIAGLIVMLASYVLIYDAQNKSSLLTAIVTLQIGLNFVLNPLAAALPERVPMKQKGRVAAVTGLAFPVSSLFGAVIIGVWLTTESQRLITVGAVSLFMILPFIMMEFRTPRLSPSVLRSGFSFVALGDRDFRIALISRLLIQSGIAINVLYLLAILIQNAALRPTIQNVRLDVLLGILLATSTSISVISGLAIGYISDRTGHRRRLVSAGALIMGLGMLMTATSPNWTVLWIAQATVGLGIGIYGIVDSVLVAEVLPSPADTGRDVGLMNLAATVAQMLAPLIGLAAFSILSAGIKSVYFIGMIMIVAGGTASLVVHRVK